MQYIWVPNVIPEWAVMFGLFKRKRLPAGSLYRPRIAEANRYTERLSNSPEGAKLQLTWRLMLIDINDWHYVESVYPIITTEDKGQE